MKIGIDIGGNHIGIGLLKDNKIIEKKEICRCPGEGRLWGRIFDVYSGDSYGPEHREKRKRQSKTNQRR